MIWVGGCGASCGGGRRRRPPRLEACVGIPGRFTYCFFACRRTSGSRCRKARVIQAVAFAGPLFVGVEAKAFRALTRPSYFLCWCKESNQRKHLPRRIYSSRSGTTQGFADSASLSPPQRGGRSPAHEPAVRRRRRTAGCERRTSCAPPFGSHECFGCCGGEGRFVLEDAGLRAPLKAARTSRLEAAFCYAGTLNAMGLTCTNTDPNRRCLAPYEQSRIALDRTHSGSRINHGPEGGAHGCAPRSPEAGGRV